MTVPTYIVEHQLVDVVATIPPASIAELLDFAEVIL